MRKMLIIMMMIMVASAIPECGAASNFEMNENNNNVAVATAMPPVFAVGRAKQWHRMNMDQTFVLADGAF